MAHPNRLRKPDAGFRGCDAAIGGVGGVLTPYPGHLGTICLHDPYADVTN